MTIFERTTGKSLEIEILPVVEKDYKVINKSEFWFSWKEESNYTVYKLVIKGTNEILGLMSLDTFESESRIEIRLLVVSKDNRGRSKKYEQIVGNLIAFSCMQSLKLFGEMACVSLVPKTQLKNHYITKYGMLSAGRSLYVDGNELLILIRDYDK